MRQKKKRRSGQKVARHGHQDNTRRSTSSKADGMLAQLSSPLVCDEGKSILFVKILLTQRK